jgi:hypothetical protein
MTVFRRNPPVAGVDAVATITESQTYQTDLLPGFELLLARLLAVLLGGDEGGRHPTGVSGA